MISPRAALVSLLPLAAAAGLATEHPAAAAGHFDGTRFALSLPPGWERTYHASCDPARVPPGDECWEVAHFRGPGGAWLRVVADGPAEDVAARPTTVTAAIAPDGTLRAATPQGPVRAMTVAARGLDRAIAIAVGADGEEPLTPEAVRDIVAGLRTK